MARSNSADFTETGADLIRSALLLISRINPAKGPNAVEKSDGLRTLNRMVKYMQTTYNLWKKVDITIPLYDDKQRYTIGPDGNKGIVRPLRASQARRKAKSDIETPIYISSRQEYMEQPTKDSVGEPNFVYYDPQLDRGVLYVWPVSNTDSVSLSDGSTDQWTVSGSGTGEYYYTGSDITAEPTFVFGGNDTNNSLGQPSTSATQLTEGTIGSLSADQYVWGDNDTLGADTLYVRIAEGDPDATSGLIKVLTSTTNQLVVTFQFPLEDFDLAANNPDFPVEWNQGLVFMLAELMSSEYGMPVRQDIATEAQRFRDMLEAQDTENAPFFVSPDYNGFQG